MEIRNYNDIKTRMDNAFKELGECMKVSLPLLKEMTILYQKINKEDGSLKDKTYALFNLMEIISIQMSAYSMIDEISKETNQHRDTLKKSIPVLIKLGDRDMDIWNDLKNTR